MERRLDFKHLEPNLKAPELFSRYLNNPELLKILANPAQSEAPDPNILIQLLNINDALNEAWFSFSTNLSDKLKSLESFLDITRPLQTELQEILKKLPEAIRLAFQKEYAIFCEIIEGIKQQSPDAMSAVSGHYINFSKLLEIMITGLSAYEL